MKVAAIVAAVVAVSASEMETQQAFVQFIKDYKKEYPTEEVFTRYNIFKANLEMIARHDASVGWTMGVNQFADMTWEEFSSNYKGYKHRSSDYYRSLNVHKAPAGQKLAASIDWVAAGAVTPVKDQAQCGSCWAFSTTGGVEGAVQIATGKLTSVSEQQLVDCAGSTGNQGCNGGLMDDAFQYIISNRGLAQESDYPYTARDGTCQSSSKTMVSPISGFTDVQSGSEAGLMSAVNMQPVSIAIEADQSGFQFYKSGVFDGACGANLDHGVLLVGYGTDSASGKDYWRVKNSWGASWGDSGYISLIRGRDICGLADAASYPKA